MDIGNYNVLDRYRKISLFNEAGTFIPLCTLLISIFNFSLLFSDQDMKDVFFVIAVSMVFVCIPIYVFCGEKVHDYNDFLKKSIMIKKVSIENINFSRGGGYTVPACIEVCYKYSAPDGNIYEKKTKIKIILEYN